MTLGTANWSQSVQIQFVWSEVDQTTAQCSMQFTTIYETVDSGGFEINQNRLIVSYGAILVWIKIKNTIIIEDSL